MAETDKNKTPIPDMQSRIDDRNKLFLSLSLFRFTWAIPSLLLGGGFLRSLFAYPLCVLFGWLMAWLTYYVVNCNYPLPSDTTFETKLREAAAVIQAEIIPDKNNGLKCELENSAQPSRVGLIFFREVNAAGAAAPPSKSVVAKLFIQHVPKSALYKTASQELRSGMGNTVDSAERVELTLWGGPGSNEAVGTIPIVLYRKVDANFPFWFTFTITTPASVHAFDRAAVSFATMLKDKATASDYNEDDGALIQQVVAAAVKKQFDSLITDVTWSRRLNGPIQAATVIAFWVLMIQLLCRIVMNYWFEVRLRTSVYLNFLWNENSPLSLPRRVAIDGRELEDLAKGLDGLIGRVREATWHQSAYLDLYASAAAAYLASSNYTNVPAFVESRANEILDGRTASQGFVKFLIWSIPALGFIGTVVGIGDALSQTVNVDSIDRAVAAVAKSEVSSSIGVAFDTTLVALVLSLVGMLTYHLISQLEELVVLDAKAEAQIQFIRPSATSTPTEMTRVLIAEIRLFRQSSVQLQNVIAACRKLMPEIQKVTAGHSSVPIFLVSLIVFALIAAVVWYWITFGR